MNKFLNIYIISLVLLISLSGYAQDRVYLCEFGVQGGVGYYVGDATQHVFNHPNAVGAASFRYKFTQRWALQVKGGWQRIKFPIENKTLMSNDIANIDVTAEFNFFRYGEAMYDKRVKVITPYIFVGVGAGLYNDYQNAGVYLPFGVGMKWKFAPRWGLTLAWQHNLYFSDNLEHSDLYNNTMSLNGTNFLKNDLTSALTLGIVFEFARQRTACQMCNY